MEADRNAVTCHHQLSILSQKNYEKLSLHSRSNGAASCKTEFSENTAFPVDSCQSACGKYEEGTYEEILVEDHRTIEKAMFSELDDELDLLDNSSSSSSSNLKGSAIASAGIAISQGKVRQISDPVQQILIQLHKIIFITQTDLRADFIKTNAKIEHWCLRQLQVSEAVDLTCSLPLLLQYIPVCPQYINCTKLIALLLQSSPELIETSIFTADWHMVLLSSGENMLLPDDRKGIIGTSDMADEQLQVSLLSKGNKELSTRRREYVILNKGFGIVPNEVNLPVLQLRLITKESSFAH